MKNKKRNIIVGVVMAVLVVGTFALAANTEFFQGRIAYFWQPVHEQVQKLGYYANKYGKAVTLVASRVPSVVVSGVDSQVSSTVVSEVPSVVVSDVPSIVVSEVPSTVVSDVTSAVGSAVGSAVASGVPLPYNQAKRINVKKLPKLTAKILKDFAAKDFVKNPAKYKLSKAEREKVLKLYEPLIQEKQNEYYKLNTVKLDTITTNKLNLRTFK